jgi:hypothetical protein
VIVAADVVTELKKMETYKFGADNPKLAGAADKRFMSKRMGKTDTPARRANLRQKK